MAAAEAYRRGEQARPDAFETGHNDGLQRQPMDTSWTAQCASPQQQQQQTAYMNGYQQGASHAGTQVVVAAPAGYVGVPGGYGYAGLDQCRFSSDCGSDMSCRPWGDMGSVCMGYGGPGSPCWFGSDCLSGWCAGAGARTCR